MEFITKKLDFSNQTITEMQLNSKNFYNVIKKRRSVRDFKKQNIDMIIAVTVGAWLKVVIMLLLDLTV